MVPGTLGGVAGGTLSGSWRCSTGTGSASHGSKRMTVALSVPPTVPTGSPAVVVACKMAGAAVATASGDT